MKGAKVLKILFIILVVSFTVHQLYASVYKPITTQNAEYTEVVDGLSITGVVMRKEYLISSNTQGVYHYLTEDGYRVSKDGVIANIYNDESASLTMSEIDKLNSQINDVTALQNYNDRQASDLGIASEKVNVALDNLIVKSSNGKFANISAEREELLLALNRRKMLTGEQTDYSAYLAELNSRLENLKNSLPAVKGNIKAQQSGYFFAATDGYEEVLNCEDISTVTVDFLENLKPQKTERHIVGKIVSDDGWYIAARVSLNDSLKYKVGDSLTLKTSVRSEPEIKCKVAAINIDDSKDSAVIVFSCDQMSREFASMRTGPMTIVNAVHSGLKAAKSALRVVDSKTGVYVVSGITLNFVEVEVVYSTDDYIICKQIKSNDKVLRLYDEVVVKGKNLYDGKIVG